MSTLDLGKLKFLWRGPWATGSTYALNDVVSFKNAIWICKQAQPTGITNEFSPGLRDRANFHGTAYDPEKVIDYNITVTVVGSQSLFFINGHRSQQITILPGFTYRFYQKDVSNFNLRFALSTTIDGTNNSGTEYTTGVTYTGTPGLDGVMTLTLASNAPSVLYYYAPGTSGVGGLSNGRFNRGFTWRGWQYWDEVTSGASFRGRYNSGTQYYANDIIEFEGSTYLAIADSTGKAPTSPTTMHYWTILMTGDRLAEDMSVAWGQNRGPIGWPYPHGFSGTPGVWNCVKWITQSGRLFNQGSGSTGSHGLSRDASEVLQSHPQEMVFNNWEWWNSRDNGGTGKMTTPDGEPPKVIQVEQGWTWSGALFNNGEVWCWGYGGYGERGDADTTATVGIPRRVVGLQDTRIVKISFGAYEQTDIHSCMALDEDGYVWTWGYNGYGQLGLGHTNSTAGASRIPREYFGGRRVIDIQMSNSQYTTCYVRTSDDNLYAWGYNNVGQIGDGTTNQKNRPVLMSSWDPLANNGIVKWQVIGHNGSQAFMILDGNGFLWHTGYNGTGTAANGGTSNNLQLTKTTSTPGGSITDFWLLGLGSGSEPQYHQVFTRTNTGATYVHGQGSSASYVNGRNATTAIITTPVAVPWIDRIKDVRFQGGNGTNKYCVWLLDSGKVLFQGTNGGFNPYIGTSNNLDETGTTRNPAHCYLACGEYVTQLLPFAVQYDTGNRPSGMGFIFSNGMIMAGGHNCANPASTQNQTGILSYNATHAGRGAYFQQPVVISHSRG